MEDQAQREVQLVRHFRRSERLALEQRTSSGRVAHNGRRKALELVRAVPSDRVVPSVGTQLVRSAACRESVRTGTV